MRALIAKEWRENRALVYGFLVLAPILSLGLKWLVSDLKVGAQAGATILYFLPAMTGLYLIAIASDLVAAESSSGRIGFLAALPVRPAKVWAAKLAFLYGSATLWLAYLFAIESILLPLFGGRMSDILSPAAGEQRVWLLYLGAGAAATLFMSTLVDKGIAAALAAVLLLGGLALGTHVFEPDVMIFGLLDTKAAFFDAAVAVVGAAFLAGSFLAFTRGRIHLGSRARRVALAFGAFLLVALPPAVHAEARLRAWQHASPDDEDLWIHAGAVSPDAKYVIVYAHRFGKGPYGVSGGGRTRAIWSVPLDGGPIVDLEDAVGVPFAVEAMEDDHTAVLLSPERVDDKDLEIVRRVDLSTGEILRTRARTPRRDPEAGAARNGPTPDGFYVVCRRDWAEMWRKREDKQWKDELVVSDGKEHHTLPPPDRGWWSAYVVPAEPSDTILGLQEWRDRLDVGVRNGNAIVPIHWRDGTLGEPIVSGPCRGWSGPPSGEQFLYLHVDGALLVDRRDLTVRPVEALADVRSIRWARDGERFFANAGGRHLLGRMDPEGRIEIEEEGVFAGLTGYPSYFDGEKAIVTGSHGKTLDVIERDGTRRRLLPRKED